MFSRCSIYILLAALLVSGHPLFGQGVTNVLSGSKSNAAQPSTPSDPLGRTTPRDAVYNFLEACHENNFLRAAQYLDLRNIRPAQRATVGPALAKQLGSLLDYDPHFEVEKLSNAPEGNRADNLPPDQDTLHTFGLNGQPVTLKLQRINQQGVNVWLVSADSVARIPQLSVLLHESALEKKLPAPLVSVKLMDTALWAWLALVLLALVLSVISRILSRAVISLIKPFAKRYAKWFHLRRLQDFTEPTRVLVSLAVLKVCMAMIPLSALLRFYVDRVITLLFFFGAASLAMRIVDVLSDRMISRLDPRERALSYSVLPLGIRFVKICIFCLAVLFTLEQWGYSTTTILAGVGVGGLAVALAAQKTIENLFGGISVITDRPVLVGDFCQFGGQLGTVEDIGLRSTKIRTLDRTVVTVPNSQFSTMTLENYSRRDRIWFHPTLRLRRDTEPEQIRQMMDAVTRILQEHPRLDASGVPLRFTKINPDSFDLEIFAYVLTADYNEFLKIQSELLLKFLETASALNVGFAVPLQESFAATAESENRGKEFRPAMPLNPKDGGSAPSTTAETTKPVER